ncbi:putative restriction endonuclease [Myxococcus fulvus]|uniref:HNH endonuclease n=1 Tax=Myxococcus fulvus TaxID=33 RepID=A0A511SX30_MYXFU|nr:HNH endonuclease [Myxococcus fulvus]GEN05873.1 HNH endonuclease [Myxococcus fulvus]SET64854.1 putative restriction endonuclease [Myxococcus fulvus]
MSPDSDWPIRVAAINALQERVRRHGDVLPWEVIDAGFTYKGETLHFANRARGIFWPRQMRETALSIKTTVPRQGREARYDDLPSDEGFDYRFQGEDVDGRDNRRLVRAMELDAPLIYFYGIEPGLYAPIWPVYISGVDLATKSFTVASGLPEAQVRAPGSYAADSKLLGLERRYTTVQVKKRLHQVAFRQHVLRAYEQRCAICRFPRRELLDAAHILPDRDVRGRPEVPNGLALCKLHHGAFDTDLLGIRPDGVIEIARRLMAEQDGPTLEHGLKGFAGKPLGVIPLLPAQRPRSEYLEERYERFRLTRDA